MSTSNTCKDACAVLAVLSCSFNAAVKARSSSSLRVARSAARKACSRSAFCCSSSDADAAMPRLPAVLPARLAGRLPPTRLLPLLLPLLPLATLPPPPPKWRPYNCE
eukprot:2842458-Pleurochrysis_carterae.AAC.1